MPDDKGFFKKCISIDVCIYVTFPIIKFANYTNFNDWQTEIKDEIMVLLPEVILRISSVSLPRINQIKAK